MFTRRNLCLGVSAAAGAASIPNLGHAAGKPLIVRVPLSFASNGMPLCYAKGPEFEIAGIRIAVSPLTLSDPAQLPDGEDRHIDGVIGMGMLRRFNILFDPDGGMWIRPNTHFV